MTSESTDIEPADVRIRRRLRTQHARWLSRQPVRKSHWFRFKRSLLTSARRSAIAIGRWFPNSRFLDAFWLIIGSIIVLGVALGILYLLTVGPSRLLLVKPDGRVFVDETERVSVALARWTVMSTAVICLLWSLMPSAAREMPLVRSRNTQSLKSQSLIRTLKNRQPLFDVNSLKYSVLLGTTVAVISVVGILFELPNRWTAMIVGILCCLANGWLVWCVGLRLCCSRHSLVGPYTVAEYLRLPLGFLVAMSSLLLFAPAIIRLADSLSILGPLGWQSAQLLRLGNGNWPSLIPLLGMLLGSSAIGWMLVKDTWSWTNRRKLRENRKYLVASEPVALDPDQAKGTNDISRQLRLDLNQTLVGRRVWSWRFWLTPMWLRRYAGWYLMLGVAMILFQLVLWPLQLLIASADPVAVIGETETPSRPSVLMLMTIPVAIIFVVLEVMAVYNEAAVATKPIEQRPISALRFWLTIQRNGLTRLPTQVLMTLPVALLPIVVGAEMLFRNEALLALLAVLILLRSMFCVWAITVSLAPIMPKPVLRLVQGSSVLGLYAACGLPILLVSVVSREQTLGSYPLGILLIANVIWIGIYYIVARYRRPITT